MTIQNENSKNLRKKCEKLGVLTMSNWEIRLKLFRKLRRFASKFHSVLGQEFFKSVLNYVEVHFRY